MSMQIIEAHDEDVTRVVKSEPPKAKRVRKAKAAPVVDAPVADAPVADAPVADAPVADAPVADAPVADAPVADAPSADAPVADAPVADAPSADAPVADAPVADAPVADAPVAEQIAEALLADDYSAVVAPSVASVPRTPMLWRDVVAKAQASFVKRGAKFRAGTNRAIIFELLDADFMSLGDISRNSVTPTRRLSSLYTDLHDISAITQRKLLSRRVDGIMQYKLAPSAAPATN